MIGYMTIMVNILIILEVLQVSLIVQYILAGLIIGHQKKKKIIQSLINFINSNDYTFYHKHQNLSLGESINLQKIL